MIFLTVGSWYRGFDRLVCAVDALKETGEIAEEVIAQIREWRPSPFRTGFGSTLHGHLLRCIRHHTSSATEKLQKMTISISAIAEMLLVLAQR